MFRISQEDRWRGNAQERGSDTESGKVGFSWGRSESLNQVAAAKYKAGKRGRNQRSAQPLQAHCGVLMCRF